MSLVYGEGMSTNMQIRDVPDELADKIRTRAKKNSLSISKYLLGLAEEDVNTVPLDDWLDMVADRPSLIKPGTDIAAMIRKDRTER